MRHWNVIRALWAPIVLVVLALVAGGCSEAPDSQAQQPPASSPPTHGGELVYGIDQQPPVLNTMLVQGGMAVAGTMVAPIMDTPIGFDPAGKPYPLLIEKVPTVENGLVELKGGKMLINFRFRSHAHWSDGHPVGCDDFKFLWQTRMDNRWSILSREGWDKVESVECPTQKDTRVVMSQPYAPYLSYLLAGYVLPQHELHDKDFNKYWNAGYTVTNGPFRFRKWHRNVRLELERDPNYWRGGKAKRPYIERITFVFLKDANTLKVQLRTGEVSMISPPPDTSLIDELKTYPRATFQSEPGPFWEQIALNARNKPLDEVDVRKAVLYSIDRRKITDVVMRKQVEPLQSTQLPAVKEYYEPAWDQYQPDPAKVEEHMTAAGFAKEGDWWVRDGKRVSLVFKTTAGNPLRMKVAQILQQQLRDNGMDMTIVMESAEVFFGQSTKQGSYDVGLWAWGSGADPSQKILFGCDMIPSEANDYAGSNYYGYCNEEVDALLKQADETIERSERARIVREIQAKMADDAPLLPVFQRPETTAYGLDVYGVEKNVIGGLFWKLHSWYIDGGGAQ